MVVVFSCLCCLFCSNLLVNVVMLEGPSLSEIEGSLAGLDMSEIEQVLSVVARDLEERQFSEWGPGLEKKDSLREIVLKNVPIVPRYYEEQSELSYDSYEDTDYTSDVIVNADGHYERFDDISLNDFTDSPSDQSCEVSSEDIEAFLSEMTEQERSHIIDVMCRDLELEVHRHEKIR